MFEEEKIYEYVTANVTISAGNIMAQDKTFIPDGKVVAIGTALAGNFGNAIVNLSILDNNNEVIKPSDVRFSEKTNGGTFKDSLRPVYFLGGKTYESRLVALQPLAANVTVQVLFMIEKTA